MISLFTATIASYWLAGALILTLIFLLIVVAKYSQLSKVVKQQSSVIAALQKEVSMVSSASMGMGQRISVLQSKLDAMSRFHDTKGSADSDVAYARALRLIDSNVDESTIMANSGLSKSEIRLMQLVNRQKESV